MSIYLGIDLGTSRTSVCASNGIRETVSSHVGYPKDVVSRKLLKKDVLFGDEALEKLSKVDKRQARIVELRFFGGLSVAEVAEVLGVSKRTVESDWTMVRAWLRRELGGAEEA